MALRCPWCARRVDDRHDLCPHCTAELVPASSWPAARMLVDAGVDRIALPERVRTLDDVTKKRLERTFELQACLVRARLVEAGALSSSLRDPDLVDAVGDTLWPLLPILPLTSPAARLLGGPDPRPLTTTGAIRALVDDDDAPFALRRLGAIVLLQRGAGTRESTQLVREALWSSDAIGREAALALAPPAVLVASRGVEKHDRERLIEALTAATKVPTLADDAAVSLVLLVVETRAQHGERLRRIVGDRRVAMAVRVGAAFALDDVDAVFDLLELIRFDDRDNEPGLQDSALRFILQRSNDDATIAGTLQRLDARDRHAALALLRRPGPLTRRELLRDIATAPLSTVTATIDLYRRAVQPDAMTVAELSILANVLDGVGLEQVLFLLEVWPRDSDGRRSREGSGPLVAALAEAVAEHPAAMVEHRLLGTLLERVRDDDVDEVRAVVGPMLRHRKHAARVLDRALGRLTRDEPPTLMTTLWTLSVGNDEAIAGWADGTARWSSRDDVIAWFWQRFVDNVGERASIVAATTGWRRALREHRDRQPREQRPGGGTAVGHLAVWLSVDDEVLTVVDDAFALVGADDLVDVVAPIIAHAHALLGRGVYRLALVTAFRLGSRIEHALSADLRRLRDDDDSNDEVGNDDDGPTLLRPSLLAAHDAFEQAIDTFVVAATARDGDDVDNARHFLDDIAVARRLLGEHRTKADDLRERRDRERQQRRDRASTSSSSSSATQPSSIASPPWTPPPPPIVVLPLPDFTPSGLDIEPFDAGLGLPTLLSYAQVLVAMQRGHDTFGIFAAAGLDVAGWVAAATRWGDRFRSKPAVALRFGELIQLPWRDL